MRQFQTDLQGAVNWVAEYHSDVETKFLEGLKNVPSWGPLMDAQVQRYLYGLANWPRCNDCWNFESGRYFGRKGREIQKSRIVELLPKVPRPLSKTPLQDHRNIVIPLIDDLERRRERN